MTSPVEFGRRETQHVIRTCANDMPPSRSRFGGLVTRRERWALSARGWLAIVTAVVLLSAAALRYGYSFLAVGERVPADILIVEGWIGDWAVRAAVAEFNDHGYKILISTGGPVPGTGGYTSDFATLASVGAERLIAAGLPRDSVRVVPSKEFARDRTYASAIALQKWFRMEQIEVRTVNVLTEAPHARRSRLLFQKALGADVKVGAIPIDNPDFDRADWWKYSEGVREVLSELIAYAYARLQVQLSVKDRSVLCLI